MLSTVWGGEWLPPIPVTHPIRPLWQNRTACTGVLQLPSFIRSTAYHSVVTANGLCIILMVVKASVVLTAAVSYGLS